MEQIDYYYYYYFVRKELQNLERASAKRPIVGKGDGTQPLDDEQEDVYLRPTNPSKSILHWSALLRGPKDTPYENGVFQLSISCGTDYPLTPPSMTFQTRVFHPNGKYTCTYSLVFCKYLNIQIFGYGLYVYCSNKYFQNLIFIIILPFQQQQQQ